SGSHCCTSPSPRRWRHGRRRRSPVPTPNPARPRTGPPRTGRPKRRDRPAPEVNGAWWLPSSSKRVGRVLPVRWVRFLPPPLRELSHPRDWMTGVRSHFPVPVFEDLVGGVMARSQTLGSQVDAVVRALRAFEPGEYSGEDCAGLVVTLTRAEK